MRNFLFEVSSKIPEEQTKIAIAIVPLHINLSRYFLFWLLKRIPDLKVINNNDSLANQRNDRTVSPCL